jgi:hypothetical protein
MVSKVSVQAEIYEEPKRRPYAARVDFLLGDDVELKDFGHSVCLLSTNNIVIELQYTEQPEGNLKHLKRYRAIIQGFATAGEAETNGLRLSMSLLWTAISRKFALRLDYHTPLPCVVYDRTAQNSGILFETKFRVGRPYWSVNAGDLAEQMQEVLTTTESVDRQLLLSMELFAAARLEMTERARFIGLVSALEPLAKPLEYSENVKQMIKKFRDQLRTTEIPGSSEQDIQRLKNSLDGRLRELEHESIRQALLRSVRSLLSDENAVRIVDSSYALRSKILHEGITDPYLDRKSNEIEDIIRRMYAACIGHALRTPATSAR